MYTRQYLRICIFDAIQGDIYPLMNLCLWLESQGYSYERMNKLATRTLHLPDSMVDEFELITGILQVH